jgi:hypothetical protein
MKIIFTIICAGLCSSAVCQQVTSAKAISFELGKIGFIYNLNYDQKFSQFGFRLGAGYNFGKYLQAATIGGGMYYLAGKRRKFFEIGPELHYLSVDEISDDQRGISLIYPNYPTKTFLASMNLGYRSYSKKILFRTGISPSLTKNEFIPGGYISVGLFF